MYNTENAAREAACCDDEAGEKEILKLSNKAWAACERVGAWMVEHVPARHKANAKIVNSLHGRGGAQLASKVASGEQPPPDDGVVARLVQTAAIRLNESVKIQYNPKGFKKLRALPPPPPLPQSPAAPPLPGRGRGRPRGSTRIHPRNHATGKFVKKTTS